RAVICCQRRKCQRIETKIETGYSAAVSRTIALVHPPSHNMDACQRTFVPQVSIDLACALAQHKAYCNALANCGCEIIETNVNAGMPDCAFIEDTAIVLDELAILGSMGAASRRSEPAGVEP